MSESRGNKRGKGRGRKGGRAGRLETRALPPLSHPERPSDADGETLQERRPFLGAPSDPLLRQVVGGKRTKLPGQAGGGPGAPRGRGRQRPRRRAPRAPRRRPPPPTPCPGPLAGPPIRLPSRLRVLREALPPKAPAAGCGGSGGSAGRAARRRGAGGGSAGEEAGGGAGGGCAPEQRSRAGYRLPSCRNFPVSWLRSLSNSRQSGRPEQRQPPPPPPPRAQLHPAEPGAPQPHKRGAGAGPGAPRRGSPRGAGGAAAGSTAPRQDAGCGGPDTSWKLLEMAPATAAGGAANLGRALAPAGLLSRARLEGPEALSLRPAVGSG